jgi:hypothetical protein
MKHLKAFNESKEIEVVLKNTRNPNIVIKLVKSLNRIVSIENKTNFRFPFKVGQTINRGLETWASNNNFLIDGKDYSPEEKIFGIRKKDIPMGHDLRMLYPSKFKK